MSSRLVRSSVNIGLMALVNLLWSTQFIGYKFLAKDLGPITVGFLISLLATLVILPCYLAERWCGTGMPSGCAKERSFRRGENLLGFLVIGVIGVAATYVLSAWGMARTSASNGALLSLTVPVMTALLAAMFLHERMTAMRWVSLVIALAGVFVLSIKAPESAAAEGLAIDWGSLALLNRDTLVGNLLVLVSCLTSSLYNVGSKGLLSRFSAMEVLTYSYCLALATTAAMIVGFEPQSLSALATFSARTWTGLLLIGVLSSGLAMVLWLFLLTRMDVGQASVSIYLLPFLGVLLAGIFLHERITFPMIAGGALTLAGTILVVSCSQPPQLPASNRRLSL